MIVPEFWAEARAQKREPGRQVTVRRFGWSDDSPEDAERHAKERADQALARVLSGEKLVRREPRVAYNGAKGVPIREEIVSRHDDSVVTRNSYGARCLNTPDVLFADVDFAEQPGWRSMLAAFGAVLAIGLVVAWHYQSWLVAIGAGLSALVSCFALAAAVGRLAVRLAGGHDARAMKRVRRFTDRHPDWHLRVYRTPRGLRILAMHRVFDPREEAVSDLFRSLDADPLYGKMCRRQNCFRARISPKPWRIGIESHLRPRPGVWPVKPDRLPERRQWVQAYEEKARGFASCRFVATLGSGTVHRTANAVRKLHDRECRSDSGLDLA